jgi:hypothetical protein
MISEMRRDNAVDSASLAALKPARALQRWNLLQFKE